MIKVLSWNVEHFKSGKVNDVIKLVQKHNPDVFGLYEVEDKQIYDIMLNQFPKYSGFLTTGQQSQQIFIACSNKFDGVKYQQKDQFKSGNPKLRPGVFLTFKYQNKMYGFLFLHTDSGTTAVDFGNRNEMFEHAINLKRKVDEQSTDPVNFIILGDLNTMGLNYPTGKNNIAQTVTELQFIEYQNNKKVNKKTANLRFLSKPDVTEYSQNYGFSNLDHVIVSDHMKFKDQPDPIDQKDYEVLLDGWRPFQKDMKVVKKIANDISDHCPLIFEVI
jgi:exonuclease III